MKLYCRRMLRRINFRGALATAILFAGLFPLQAGAQDRALIVSIDKYADSRLSGSPAGVAENDAASIRKLLLEKLGYKAEQIKMLRNEQATKAAVLKAFETWLGSPLPAGAGKTRKKLIGLDESGALGKKKKKLKKKRKKKARSKAYRSFFYFSGLGYFRADQDGDEADGLDETLVPYDASVRPVGGRDELEGAILDDELAGVLEKFTARHVTMVLDASHSGIVTRSASLAGKNFSRARAPTLKGAVRSISDDKMEQNKGEGAFVDVKIPRGSVSIWSAASPTQTALNAGEDEAPQGLFTLLFTEGVFEPKADANANAILSGAELLRHVIKGSAAYCSAYRGNCEMGLRPRLDPPGAYGRPVWVNRKKVTRAREKRLTLPRLMDFLGPVKAGNIEVRQTPSSPLHVGAGDIRYEIVSPSSGYLILLNLTSEGKLFQLYPNQFSGSTKAGRTGMLKAGTPLVVPEQSYGVSFSATEPGKGHIIAIVTPDPVTFEASVTSRAITSISPREALNVYLAGLSAALHHPLNMDLLQSNTGTARWSLNALPYEILP